MERKKSSFSGALGFVLTAAGCSVGIGNITRFPYLAAKDGGLFVLMYLILVATLGFTLLTTDIAIGRGTKKSALEAFGTIRKKWSFLGKITFLVPAIIMTYYSVIGGWTVRYALAYLTGQSSLAAKDGYFQAFIASGPGPVVCMLAFLAVTTVIVYFGVEKGIERFSKVVMPGLLILIAGIAVFSLSLRHTTEGGELRTGIQGIRSFLTPDLSALTFREFWGITLDALSQLFFSLSVSTGIMITYGSYVKKDVNLSKSIRQIELCDTGVALLVGLMIIPAVHVFSGPEGMTQGQGLMFITLPKVFRSMGAIGRVIGTAFFVMVVFAALSSAVSLLETVVVGAMEVFHTSRKKICMVLGTLLAAASVVICLGYNVLYFELRLPNGTIAQLLDVMDYISTCFLMPLISFLTCYFVGWVIKPKWIENEMLSSGHPFARGKFYSMMIRHVCPVIMAVLFLQSTGILK